MCESHPAHSYSTIWDTISIVNSEGGDLLVYNSDKIIVPQEARQKILNDLHKSHAGSEAMFKTARASLWWPDLKIQCTQLARQCEQCKEYAIKQSPGPPNKDVEDLSTLNPMDSVGMDLFYIKSKPILVIVDKASSHIKCFLLKNRTSRSVCEKVEDW